MNFAKAVTQSLSINRQESPESDRKIGVRDLLEDKDMLRRYLDTSKKNLQAS